MNRVAAAIDRVEARVATLTEEKADKLSREFDMGLEDYSRFQELKSIAVLANVLSLEEASLVSRYLGNTPETFNRQPLPVKAVLTNLLLELVDREIARLTQKGGCHA